jgi:rare lipoprotein A
MSARVLMLAVLLLAGCATGPAPIRTVEPGGAARPTPRPSAGAPGAPVTPVAPSAPAPGARRGGGFYLDDGPGQGAPADPDSVPDAVPRLEPVNPRNSRPYVVFERQYVPMTRLEPFRERGIASWYGRRYHGQSTSSGEPYDMHAMTAAHTILPIPSYARVTHLASGRSVVVRINDRGPFLHGRVIDLSWTAAARLGYVQAGSAEVEVELIHDPEAFRAAGPRPAPAASLPPAGVTPAPMPAPVAASPSPSSPSSPPVAPVQPAAQTPARLTIETLIVQTGGASATAMLAAPAAPTPAPAAPTPAPGTASGTAPPPAPTPAPGTAASVTVAPGIWLQLGAFSQQERALAARERAASLLGLPPVQLPLQPAGALWRVLAGPYASRGDAVSAAERLRQGTDLQPIPITVGP